MSRTNRFSPLYAVVLICIGCSALSPERVRTATYARDFHYITKQEIHTTMGGLAVEVSELDRIMGQDGGPGPEDRERVVEILARMRVLAGQLKRRQSSNHSRIRDHAPQLQEDIERARMAVARQPPNYYYAGLVSGACSYCHAPRDLSDGERAP